MANSFNPDERIPAEDIFSDETLRAIGLLVVSAAAVDSVLSFQILRTITNDHLARFNAVSLVAGQDISVKLGVLRTFLLHRVKHKEILEHCFTRIQKCFDKRNLFAHGIAGKGKNGTDIGIKELKFKGEARALPDARFFTAKQILSYARELKHRAAEVDAELTRLGIAPFGPIELAELNPPPRLGEDHKS